MLNFRTNGSVLREHLQLENSHCLDVGSSTGALVHSMTQQGPKLHDWNVAWAS